MAALAHGLRDLQHPAGLFGAARAAGLEKVLPDLAHGLDGGQPAVADGGIHIVHALKRELAQKLGQQLFILQKQGGNVHPAKLALEAGPAADDVFLALFPLEPLLDLGSGLVGLADGQPVAGGALGGLGGEDLHNVAVVELHVVAGDAVVDLGADHGVAHAGVDGIGKVDGRGARRQGDHLAAGREDKDLVVEHIHLEAVDIVLGVGLLLALEQAADPFKFLFVARFDALLVFPVRGHAVFGGLMHLLGADLHLKGDALVADDRGMQALVHIGLGRGDIVLEAPGQEVEHLVDVAQDVVAVGNAVYDHAEGVEVIQLVDGLALGLHLAVDGVDVLDPPGDGAGNAHRGQPLGDAGLDGLHKHLGLLLVGVEIGHELFIAVGVEILQGAVLELPLDLLHAEAVRQGRVDVHGLHRLGDLLGPGLVFHGALVVQAVADLDEHHADVLGHGHKELAQVFHLLLFQGGELHPGQLGDALDQLRHGLAELCGDIVKRGVGVLDAVVQKGREDGVGIQADLGHDLGHGQGVDDIGRAVLALLALVFFIGISHRPLHALQIGIGCVLGDGLHHCLIVVLKGLHTE